MSNIESKNNDRKRIKLCKMIYDPKYDPDILFEYIKLIGKGSYGKVYEVKCKKDGLIYAIKILNIDDNFKSESLENIENEIEHLKIYNKNDYIVEYHDTYMKEDKIYIKLECCNIGSLNNIIKYYRHLKNNLESTKTNPRKEKNVLDEDNLNNNVNSDNKKKIGVKEYENSNYGSDAKKTNFNEKEVSIIIRNVLNGLKFLHEKNIIHRDIKPDNILMTCDNKNNEIKNIKIKLTDFGITTKLIENKTKKIDELLGTPYWLSPEIIEENVYSKESDIWALGISAYELLENSTPYFHLHPLRAILIIPKKDPPKLNDKYYSKACCDFIDKCLKKNRKERYSVEKLLEHEFIKKYKKFENDVLVQIIKDMKEYEDIKDKNFNESESSSSSESD